MDGTEAPRRKRTPPTFAACECGRQRFATAKMCARCVHLDERHAPINNARRGQRRENPTARQVMRVARQSRTGGRWDRLVAVHSYASARWTVARTDEACAWWRAVVHRVEAALSTASRPWRVDEAGGSTTWAASHTAHLPPAHWLAPDLET